MALVRTLTAAQMQRTTVHDEADATYASFEMAGQRYLQVDGYGRAEREMPGKKSQTLQFDRRSAVELIEILRREFNLR